MIQNNSTLQFKTTEQLRAAKHILEERFIFRVYNVGREHWLAFRTPSDAAEAARVLKEENNVETPTVGN